MLKAGPFPQASFADAWDPGDEVLCQAFRSPWVLGWASRATLHGSQREGPKLLRTLADDREEPLATPREAHLSMYRAPASASCWNFLICPFHASLYSVTPIFTLSSVSGESLDLLKVFLNILPPLTNSKEQEELMQQLTEFQVTGHLNRQ